jgi:hypothetical protein
VIDNQCKTSDPDIYAIGQPGACKFHLHHFGKYKPKHPVNWHEHRQYWQHQPRLVSAWN